MQFRSSSDDDPPESGYSTVFLDVRVQRRWQQQQHSAYAISTAVSDTLYYSTVAVSSKAVSETA